jgi:hypothetical protein
VQATERGAHRAEQQAQRPAARLVAGLSDSELVEPVLGDLRDVGGAHGATVAAMSAV